MTKPIPNFVTCHCHQQSLDTASTPEAFAKREVELGTGYLTVTDHGTLQAALKVRELAKKNNLTPIIGLEAYLRDDDCPILKRFGIKAEHPKNDKGEFQLDKPKTMAHYSKYFHLTMHFQDQEALETGIKLLSKADERAERHGQERKPLFTWDQLEELGGKNVTMTSSCLIGVVQRHLLDHNNIDIATAYYEKMRGICKPGNFYTEVFPHNCDRNWDAAAFVVYLDGTEERFPQWKKLRLSLNGEVREHKLEEWARKDWSRNTDPTFLVAAMENRKWAEREPKAVKGIELREGYILNDCRPWSPFGNDADIQRACNFVLLGLSQEYGDKVIIGDDSHFALPEEKVVQDVRLQASGGSWRFYGSYHRQSSQEALEHFRRTLGVTPAQFEGWVENSYGWAEGFKKFKMDAPISLPTKFYPADSFEHTMKLIDKVGRMDWSNQVWSERLKAEIQMLFENGKIDLLPYFFPIEEVVNDVYETAGKLPGPGRGSAAGLLLSYLLGITHVDPLKYGLSKDRFLTMDRIISGKMPDIDQDLPDRELLTDPETGWLKKRFGDHYAQISVDTTLKLRSSVKDVCRVYHGGKVPPDVEVMTKKFENPPQGISDYDFVFGYENSDKEMVPGSIETDPALMEFVEKYPKEWEVVSKCLGLPRQKGRHACAYVIANKPINEFIPLTSVSDVTVTQYTAPSVEAAGGLKMDFLVVNSLNDIADAIRMVQERNGGVLTEPMQLNGKRVPPHRIVPFRGAYYDIWDLPDDQPVYRDFCEGKTETVFQFNTPGAVGWLKNFDRIKGTLEDGTVVKALDSIEALAAFTALDRPGPLDYFLVNEDGTEHNMLVEFARRSAGLEPAGASLPILNELLPETYGVIVYQEQLTKIYQVLGGTSGAEADEFRVHISKKQMAKVIKDKEVFMRGAVQRLGEEDAQKLWDMMETFARYGFNKSHAVCYVVVSYACAFLKHHYQLEWWCSVLRNADKDEINSKFWNFCGHLIDLPDVGRSGQKFEIQGGRIRAPLSLLHGVGEAAHNQLVQYAPYSSIDDFCQKVVDHKKNGTTVSTKEVEEEVDILDPDGQPSGETRLVKKLVEKTTKGRSALNKKVVATLIVSGAMDSLFPSEMSSSAAIYAYNEAMARAEGKRKVDKVDPKYLNLSPWAKYQMRKAILPAYSENLLPLLTQMGHRNLSLVEGRRPEWHTNKYRAPIVTLDEVERLNNKKPWPAKVNVTVGVLAYVSDERKFNYSQGREAVEMVLDVDGSQLKAVKWGGKDRLPDHFKVGFKGGIAVVLLTKYSEDRPFVVEEAFMVQNPLDHEAEASPDPT